MSPVFAGFTGVSSAGRLAAGGLMDRGVAVPFRFDGQAYSGFAGDTLASALMANGVRLLGRSFKYHRPRGLVGAGVEEPNALMEVRTGGRREPNVPATVVELFAGLEASSQNRFPSLRHDVMAVNGLLGGVFSAGFYYKTFMWPAGAWERVYEPLIRRAAGLGRAATEADPDHYARGHLFCDVLVVGGGVAGLAAALAAGRAGARVVLADEDFRIGGRLLSEAGLVEGVPGAAWAARAEGELRGMPGVRVMPRTTVFGVYDQGTYGAVERNGDHVARCAGPRQTYWRIVARRCVLAAGAFERPLVFSGNDRPGVMLAGAVRTYLQRYAAVPGRRAVVATSGAEGWRTVDALQAAGVEVVAVVDRRAEVAPRGDVRMFAGGHVVGTSGRLGLEAVRIADGLGQVHRVGADLLAMAGGWSPNLGLTCHLGGRPVWDGGVNAFVPGEVPAGMVAVGAASGRFGVTAALADGAAAGVEAAGGRDVDGRRSVNGGGPRDDASQPSHLSDGQADRWAAPPRDDGDTNPPVWLMPTGKGKAFVDFQHDVTAADVALSHREGFRSVEHLKRYTTLGMGTDQGKLSNVTGLAMMADLTGAGMGEGGTTRLRPPYTPVTIGTLAGHSVGRDFRPVRLSPLHDWALGLGAEMIPAGAWMRASHFPRGREDWRAACDREVRTVRGGVGVCDVSTLGKIELVGGDVGAFLDRVYVNIFSTLKVGRVRYGVMLREDGFAFDDGTVARLEGDRWLMTTTTAHAGAVLAHLEFCAQVLWPALDVRFASVTDQWAQMGVAGPGARAVLERVVAGDVSDGALPYMGCVAVRAAGVRARVFRISFSGELAYEVAVPARHGGALGAALIAAARASGGAAYGLEALNVMRIEKGHVAGGELTGQTTARDLGLGRMMSGKKEFIGRAMAGRPALVAADRPGLVGLRAFGGARLRAGAHLLTRGAAAVAENDQGWVTSAAHSEAVGGSIGLAMLKSGLARLGERIRVYDPIRNGDAEAEVVAPCFYDPGGERLHG